MTKKPFKADERDNEDGLLPQEYYFTAEDEIDLFECWNLLWNSRFLIAFITLLFTVLAVTAALLMTPVYKAEILLAPASAQESGGISLGGLGGLASLVGVSGSLGGGTDEGLAVLKSRLFLSEFFIKESLLPIMFEEQWQEKEPDSRPTMWDAYELFTKQVLAINLDKKSGMINLSISWKDPIIAADWANKLVVVLNEHMRNHAIKEAAQSIDYLNQQISQTSVLEMQQMLYGLIEDETKKTMLANVRTEYAFKVIDPAVAPERKTKPKRAFISILGMVCGFLFAVILVFFIEFIRKYKQEHSARLDAASLH